MGERKRHKNGSDPHDAVLVRRHGLVVWAHDALSQAEADESRNQPMATW